MYMFLDARPFGSLQAFKLCFCLEDPQDYKKGQPSNAYVEEFIFQVKSRKLILRDIKKKRGGRGQIGELSELFTVLSHL